MTKILCGKYLILHTKFTLALSTTTKGARVTEHIVQGNLSDGSELILADFTIYNSATSLIDTSDNIA